MLMGQTDYSQYLRDVLEQRAKSNSRYSLRAFARDLQLSPQMLSFVLNKKKDLSPESAADVAENLELNPVEASYFVDLVSLRSRSGQIRKLAQYRIDERLTAIGPYKSLDVDVFNIISSWQHFAILELTCTPDFDSDPKWIAGRLGITVHETSQAIERLKKLELLEIDKNGQLVKTEMNIAASFGVPSAALRKLARQLLQKAIEALDHQSIEERDITNITMAIDPARIPRAQKMIDDFSSELCAYLEKGDRTEVYTFASNLFRLTTKKLNGGIK